MIKVGKVFGNNGGFALVVVILVMLISSFLASQLIMQIRTDMRIAANNQERVVDRMLAEGGISLGIFRLIDQPGIDYEEKLGGPKLLGGHVYETVLSTGKIEYYAVSESGKIDLNRAPIELMRKFLAYQGLEDDEIDVVVDSWQDWRDNDDLHRANGAERNYYEELENPYIPRNGRIEDPGEFFLIRGTGALRGKFDPYAVFTVDNNSPKININELSPEMLDFLIGGNKELAKRVREEQESLLPDRLTKVRLLEITGDSTLNAYLTDSTTVSKYYSIVSYGYTGDYYQDDTEKLELESDDNDSFNLHRSATKVRVLIEKIGQEFHYHAWREQFV